MKARENFSGPDQLLPNPIHLTDAYPKLDAPCDFFNCSNKAIRQCPVCGKYACGEHDGHGPWGMGLSERCVCRCSGSLIWGTVWGCSVDTIGRTIVGAFRSLEDLALKVWENPGKDYMILVTERDAVPVRILFMVHGNRFKADVRSWVSSAPPVLFSDLRDQLVPIVEQIMKMNGLRRSYRIGSRENHMWEDSKANG